MKAGMKMRYTDYRRDLENNEKFLKARDELNVKFTLGKAVVRGRINKGWSQTKLAEEVGTKQANISRIESGLANPTLILITKITKALDITIRFDDYITIRQGNTTEYRNVFTVRTPITSQQTYQYPIAASGEIILHEAMKA
jgi:ribosome-binding protein aMBF1 (putative translation factor)